MILIFYFPQQCKRNKYRHQTIDQLQKIDTSLWVRTSIALLSLRKLNTRKYHFSTINSYVRNLHQSHARNRRKILPYVGFSNKLGYQREHDRSRWFGQFFSSIRTSGIIFSFPPSLIDLTVFGDAPETTEKKEGRTHRCIHESATHTCMSAASCAFMAVYTSAICTRAWKPEPLSNMTILSTFPNLQKICWRATMVTYVRTQKRKQKAPKKNSRSKDVEKKKSRGTGNEKRKHKKSRPKKQLVVFPF